MYRLGSKTRSQARSVEWRRICLRRSKKSCCKFHFLTEQLSEVSQVWPKTWQNSILVWIRHSSSLCRYLKLGMFHTHSSVIRLVLTEARTLAWRCRVRRSRDGQMDDITAALIKLGIEYWIGMSPCRLLVCVTWRLVVLSRRVPGDPESNGSVEICQTRVHQEV